MQKYFLFHKFHDIAALNKIITEFIKNSQIGSVNIYSYRIDSLWNAFKSYFSIHIAAGGLLLNDNNEMLFIRRKGKWDIPKGHISGDESLESTAIREIHEETGLLASGVKSKLKPSYHIYKLHGKWILKETHWYIFNFDGEGTPVPQEVEGITEVRWFKKDNTAEVRENTWLSIIGVINEAVFKLQDN